MITSSLGQSVALRKTHKTSPKDTQNFSDYKHLSQRNEAPSSDTLKPPIDAYHNYACRFSLCFLVPGSSHLLGSSKPQRHIPGCSPWMHSLKELESPPCKQKTNFSSCLVCLKFLSSWYWFKVVHLQYLPSLLPLLPLGLKMWGAHCDSHRI